MGLKLSKKGRRHRSYSFSEKDKANKTAEGVAAEAAGAEAADKKSKKSKRSVSSAAKFSLKKEKHDKSSKVSGHNGGAWGVSEREVKEAVKAKERIFVQQSVVEEANTVSS